MEMGKRALIAIVLSIIILVLYQQFFLKPGPQVPEPQRAQKEIKDKNSAPGQALTNTFAFPSDSSREIQPVINRSKQIEQFITVDTPLYRARLSSRCGSFSSFELKKYLDRNGKPVNLLKQPDGLALCIGDEKGFYPEQLNFSIKGKDLSLSEGNPSGMVVFEYYGEGVSIRRTYTFRYNQYLIDIKDEVKGLSQYWVSLGGDFGIFERDRAFHTGPVVLKDLNRIEFKEKGLESPKYLEGKIKWIALEDKYFFSALIPSSHQGTVKVWLDGKPKVAMLVTNQGSQAGGEGIGGINEYKLYAGPKEHDSLKSLGLGLEHIIDFGFFSIVARPLFWILKALYKAIGNYGWAIVVLSILIRIPFTPLIIKGQKSMKKLQELQPRIEELRKKYKDDPKRLQQETMELYKKYKVNPFGGCLPILIQLPVFFALYKVLAIAIELRGAPFIFWIKDLSQKDPYYVLPILMGASMIIQQIITPSAGDPRQKRLMLFMSGFFTLLFLSFPSGLVLYWFTTNIVGILHQLYLNRHIK